MSNRRIMGFQVPQQSAANGGVDLRVPYDVKAAREPLPDSVLEQIRQRVSQQETPVIESLGDWLNG